MTSSRPGAPFSLLAGTLGIATGSIVLIGWAFDIRILKQPLPTIASMKPNTALAFVLASFSLCCLAAERFNRLSAALGSSVALLGLLMLLMDIRLQGEMDGVTAAEHIRRICAPIVFLTAFSDAITVQRATATEPFGYILKPVDDRELEIAISVALYRRQAEPRVAEWSDGWRRR